MDMPACLLVCFRTLYCMVGITHTCTHTDLTPLTHSTATWRLQGDRVVSALNGGRAERAWALNALCLLSFRQEIHLGATPGLLAALLPVGRLFGRCWLDVGCAPAWLAGDPSRPCQLASLRHDMQPFPPPTNLLCRSAARALSCPQVLQEGLADAVGLSNGAHSTAPDPDAQREAAGLPPLPGWQARRAARLAGDLFLDHARLQERLQEAAAAAVVLRNAAEAQQNSALLLDPPVMRCWTWSLNAARELVLQQHAGGEASSIAGGGGPTASGGGPTASAGGGDGTGPSQAEPQPQEERQQQQEQPLAGLVVGGGPAADICTSLLQLTTVLSGRMLLPAFFECGMLLLRSLLILLRPTWQQTTSGGAVLPPPLVSLAALAVTAVATAYQPNTDILLSMTSGPGQPGAPGQPGTPGQPGATLMQVVADLLVCPFEVFRCGTAQLEAVPGSWRGGSAAVAAGLWALQLQCIALQHSLHWLWPTCVAKLCVHTLLGMALLCPPAPLFNVLPARLLFPPHCDPAGSMWRSKWMRSPPAGATFCPQTPSYWQRRGGAPRVVPAAAAAPAMAALMTAFPPLNCASWI